MIEFLLFLFLAWALGASYLAIICYLRSWNEEYNWEDAQDEIKRLKREVKCLSDRLNKKPIPYLLAQH